MTPYLSGVYRRRLRMVITAADTVEGGLEDDFHHFTVTLRHNGARVTSVDAGAVRWPWTTCPDAATPLRAIEGMPLSPRCLAVGDHADPRMNCTHMFDLAGLAVAHAARGGEVGETRQYDVEIPYGVQAGGQRLVRLARDGEPRLEWTIAGRGIESPPPYSEQSWRGGFLRWADRTLEVEDAEAAIVAGHPRRPATDPIIRKPPPRSAKDGCTARKRWNTAWTWMAKALSHSSVDSSVIFPGCAPPAAATA